MKEFKEILNRLRINWELLSRILRIFEVLAIIGGVIFATVQIRDLRNSQSTQLMLEFNKDLNSDINASLITAIEENKPILKENGGEFTPTDIDRYLGAYELLNNVSEAGLISDDMLYNAFSYDIIKTYQNKEIQDYLSKIRQEDSSFFRGFELLAKDLIKAEAYRK